MRNRKHDGNKSSVVNFGVQGLGHHPVLSADVLAYAGMVNSGSNVTAPAIAEKFGILPGTVLNMNTVAGVVGVIFFIVVGQINRVIGARITSGVCLIVAGLAYLGVGNAVNLAMYTVCMCIVVGGVMSAGYISGGDLVTKWFPKKKGIVMGYTTMGHNLASVAFVPLITLLVGRLGIGNGVIPISVCAIVLGIFGLLLVRNTPQERGLNPDNVSDEVYRTEYFHGHEDPTGGWTDRQTAAVQGNLAGGRHHRHVPNLLLGVVSQMVLRNMELGFSREQATFILSLVALIGLVGSFFVGYMDERLGTKKSMLFFGIWYALSLLANATENTVLVYVSIFMIGMSIGGSANFTTSLTTSVFGRQGFSKVNSVVFPIQGAVSALSFVVNGVVSNITGGNLRYTYLIFAGVSVVSALIVLLVDERHRFNKDWQQGQNARSAS